MNQYRLSIDIYRGIQHIITAMETEMIKIILGIIGLTCWMYVLIMRSIKLISSNISKEIHQQ